MPFEHVVTVRFHEVDRAGIAFFGRVFEYCHLTFEELVAAADVGISEIFDNRGWGMPLVHTEADFKGPMRLGDRLTVGLEVGHVGKSSIAFAFEVRGSGGELRATAKLVHAFVDLRTFESIEVPELMLDILEGAGLR